jgi:putative SOS response-associated peptidase YedK
MPDEGKAMCNLYDYEMTPEIMASIVAHYRLVGREWLEVLRTNDGKVYPKYDAPVGVLEGERLAARRMSWGFPPPDFVKSKAPVTNVRHVAKGYWRPYLGREHRCIVPAMAFSEFDQELRLPRWFRRADGLPFFFAGIWRTWTGDRGTRAKPNVGEHTLFSFLTTEPNRVVAPIHPKAMPVLLLDNDAIERWLTAANDDALALQKPAPDGALVLLPPIAKAA